MIDALNRQDRRVVGCVLSFWYLAECRENRDERRPEERLLMLELPDFCRGTKLLRQ